MSFPRLSRITAGMVVVAWLPLQAMAQFPFGGMGGGGPNPMAEMMERVVVGTVEDTNPVRGYIQVNVPGRGSRIVIAGEGTAVTAMAEVPVSELQVGEEITVTGAPTVVAADTVRLGQGLGMQELMQALMGGGEETPREAAPDEGAPADDGTDGGAPAEGPAPGAPGDEGSRPGPPPAGPGPGPPGDEERGPSRRGPASPTASQFTGTIKSVQPLVIVVPDGQEITIAMPDGAKVLRRAPGSADAARPGDEIVAIGDVDEDGYLQATQIHLGETVSFGRRGFGRSRGGRGGRGEAPTMFMTPMGPGPGREESDDE